MVQDAREQDEAQLGQMCENLEKLVARGNFREAARLRYEIFDRKETMGGMEELDAFLTSMGDKITEQRKKERESKKSGVS